MDVDRYKALLCVMIIMHRIISPKQCSPTSVLVLAGQATHQMSDSATQGGTVTLAIKLHRTDDTILAAPILAPPMTAVM